MALTVTFPVSWYLDKIVARKKKGSTEKLSAQVGKILARYKMGKFVEWAIETGRLQWHFKEAHIEQEKLFDGAVSEPILQTVAFIPEPMEIAATAKVENAFAPNPFKRVPGDGFLSRIRCVGGIDDQSSVGSQ